MLLQLLLLRLMLMGLVLLQLLLLRLMLMGLQGAPDTSSWPLCCAESASG